MRAIAVALLSMLAVAGAVAQPVSRDNRVIGRDIRLPDRLPVLELPAESARRMDRAADLVDRATGRGLLLQSLDLDRLIGRFAARELANIQRRKTDAKYRGVIGTISLGGTEISLERRVVLTGKGPLPLLLTRMGSDYVYDGDIVVPPFAIEGVGFPSLRDLPASVTFAAGVAGTFGAGQLWDDAILPFEVADDFCCRTALQAAIADMEARTIFRFVPRDGHATYLRFINAEPFTSSRVSMGKQHGENAVRIQGFRLNGARRDDGDLMGTIQHEVSHELGLIHEHLRSDRDDHIARNPSCTPGDLGQAIYEGWIDVTNVAFTDDQAELLTGYDFNSLMHYEFLLDNNGDGAADCSTWVRTATCADGDASSPTCIANFGNTLLSALDIEGLHRLYSRAVAEPDRRTFTADNIRHRGKRIDRCLHGLPLGQNGCSAASREKVADAFCATQGFTDGFDVQTESMWGVHSGFDDVQGWRDVLGADVVSAITCETRTDTTVAVETGTLEEQTFAGTEIQIHARQIDRCVWGDGVTGDRCSQANQQLVADRFCTEMGFESASAFETGFAPGLLVGFHPATSDFRGVSGLDIFTEIGCVRSP